MASNNSSANYEPRNLGYTDSEQLFLEATDEREPGSGEIMKTVSTFTAQIYVGLKHRPTGVVYGLDVARGVIQKYVDEVGLCVTFTPTEYIYSKGSEPGLVVGLINYPRFPSDAKQIVAHAMELGKRLRKACRQFKVSIVMPTKTVMIGTAK